MPTYAGTKTTAVATSADLELTLSDSPDPVSACNTLTYASDVTYHCSCDGLHRSLHSFPTRRSSDLSASNGGTDTAGTVTWNLGTLAASGNTSLTLVVKVDANRTAKIGRAHV